MNDFNGGGEMGSPYMEAISAQRSMLLSEEEALLGGTLISAEAQDDLAHAGFLTYVQDNLENFIRAIRSLQRLDQDLILGYYMLGKQQAQLAMMFGSTQTLTSYDLRLIVKSIAGLLKWGGQPSLETIREILVRNKLEEHALVAQEAGHYSKELRVRRADEAVVYCPLSQLLWEYQRCHSFEMVAARHNLHRPEIRRAFREAAQVLRASAGIDEQLLGAHMEILMNKANTVGTGVKERHKRKLANIYAVSPKILGEFRIDIEHPDFAHVFSARANIFA